MPIFAHDLTHKYKGQFMSVSQEVKVCLFESKLEKKFQTSVTSLISFGVEVEI